MITTSIASVIDYSAKMAVNRRGYIFGVLILSIVCVLLIVVSAATGSWVSSGLFTFVLASLPAKAEKE